MSVKQILDEANEAEIAASKILDENLNDIYDEFNTNAAEQIKHRDERITAATELFESTCKDIWKKKYVALAAFDERGK